MIIAIDFDGTIVDHAYPIVGKPNPSAIDWIKRFIELEAKIILYTMRSGSSLTDAKKYLANNDVPELYGYNFNPNQKFWTSSPKVYANIYVDDAAFGCPMINIDGFQRSCVDWSIIGPSIEEMILGSTNKV